MPVDPATNGDTKRAHGPMQSVEEESQTLVSNDVKSTTQYEPSGSRGGERGGSGRCCSTRCQIMAIFAFTAVFMFLVGFIVGRDTVMAAINKVASTVGGKVDNGKSSSTPGTQTSAPTAEPTVPPSESYAFDVKDLQEAKALASDALTVLENYWSEYDQVLLGDKGFTFGFTGPNKGPSNVLSFKRTKDIIARVLVNKDALKLGFIGSSVMCGHDNCYYDSFPEQLRRFIGPIFKKATGREVEIRNGCQGGTCGDSYQNQIFCFRHMVGDDIDMLFYEWTYFENSDATIYHEAITRWATLLPKVPATIIVNCGDDAWGNEDLPKRYAKWGANGINIEGGLKQGPYKGKVWGEIGDGVHQTTRYGEGGDVSETRRKSLGVVFRNWHPGPLGLQYVSDLTSYLVLRAMVAAIDEIIADPTAAPKKWPEEVLEFEPLPPISFNKKKFPLWYDLAGLQEDGPGCFTIQQSTYGKPQSVIADRPGDPLNPYRDQVKKVGSNDESAWSIWTAGINWAMVPREERSMGDICKPVDKCAYFVEPKTKMDATPFVWRLPKMEVGLIVICGNGGEAGKELLKVKDKFTVEFDGKVLDSSKYEVFPHSKCLRLQERFDGPVDNKHGHLYLSIVTSVQLKISQVITA